jgi:hypothetical protein
VNNLAISPYVFMHILQLQNIKRDVAKKIPLDILKKSDNTNDKNSDKLDIQTTNINDLPSNERNELINEPAPVMEYENFGAEIK